MKTRIIIAINFILILSSTLFAQCNPGVRNSSGVLVTSATFCEGQLINFEANSPGYTTTTSWDFSPATSSQQNPTYSYSAAGNYTVTFTGTGPAGTCTETVSVTIKPSPDIYITNITADSQCFAGNSFCINDKTESPNGKIVRQTYLISNGIRIDYFNPTQYGTNRNIDTTLCISLYDPTGGSFDLVVQSEDSNGCVATKTYQDMFYIKPKIGASFDNVTSLPNPGCGTVLGTYKNTSTMALANVDSFIWDFGNGTSLTGNSTSTALWEELVSHLYTTVGSFDVTLTVYANGCTENYVVKNAVSNIMVSDPIIESYGDVHFASDNPIKFDVKNLPTLVAVDRFLWNFGDPPSGPQNTNDRTLQSVSHNYSLGPKLISFRIEAGPCDVTIYDTITVIGPKATIEVPFGRIPQSEKNQCGTSDSVHFTNHSTFYQNDANPNDEDSTVLVNGKKEFVFNYTPPTGSNSIGIGDQTAVTPTIVNRTMGSQVVRIWDFGDEHAPQCTTSTAKNWNIGVNCNYSEDEFPVHKYQSWDSIYHDNYFVTNDSFAWTKFNESTLMCYIEQVDTNNASKHREIFNKTIPKVYTATLWLRDTVQNSESADTVTIDLRKPDASKMKLVSGTPCPYNSGNNEYVLEFDINTDGHSYFAVNFDSIAYGTTGFTPYNQGILAPPTPGSPIPFQLPSSIRGDLGDHFVKGYTQAEVGPANLRNPKGSFTMGLIVGNGPAIPAVPGITPGSPATCLDTVWYPDMFRIPALDSDFEIISPSTVKKTICAGKEAYFEINTPYQNNIEVLRWNWGHQVNVGRGPQLDVYAEQFTYLENYTGPSPTRNDKDISYNGEDWLYNYVVRSTLNDVTGVTIIDTIVTSIVKDWKNVNTIFTDPQITTFDVKEALGYHEIPEEEYYKLLGDGLNGCIDTTGMSQWIIVEKSEYKNNNGDYTYMVGDRRYRYTNAAQTDSVEVAHVLHFRDSSLQGYDTLIVGTDTTTGVWKHEYSYQEMVNGVPIRRASNGPMQPSLSLTNTTGCNSNNVELLNVGFLNEYTIQEKEICEGLPVVLDHYQRYYQYGVEDFNTYPINDSDYWGNFFRYNNNLETYEMDWDSTDGVWDGERSIIPNHIYTDPGEYTLSVVTKDSNNCRDTVYIDVSISKVEPYFGYEQQQINLSANKLRQTRRRHIGQPCKGTSKYCQDPPQSLWRPR